jgi:Right handed beta helix region/Secretion system C-terminal sorting domain
MKSFVQPIVFCIIIMLSLSPVFAVTLNVPTEYGSVQAGLDASAIGDTVLVQPGTYFENILWPQVNGIKLIAAGDTSNTFIDANQNGRVISMSVVGVIDSTTLIQGFTLQNGNSLINGGGIYCYQSSPVISSCRIIGNSVTDGEGGGIACYYSDPTISDCIIDENTADSPTDNGKGGGIYCEQSSPAISNCSINGNFASSHGGGICCRYNSIPAIINSSINGNSARSGGGVYCWYYSDATINECTISGNLGIADGGGVYFENSVHSTISNCTINDNISGNDGGGISCRDRSSPTIVNCLISGNSADDKSGGIHCFDFSSPMIDNCSIIDNWSVFGGGGIYCSDYSSPMIINSTICGNSTNQNGGGIRIRFDCSPRIVNCTLSDNSAGGIGGGIRIGYSGTAIVRNCAITDNVGGGISVTVPGSVETTFCDFYNNSNGNFGGTGADPELGVIVGINANADPCDVYFNIFLDPLYVDPDNGDYHLQGGSPCIDAGDPASLLDPDNTVADIGALYYDHNNPDPVEVTLSPTSSTELPAGGGTLSFDVHVVSNVPFTYPNVMFWTKVKLPNGIFFPQFQFETTFTLTPYMDVTGSLIQDIPAFAPAGNYEMWGWVGLNPNFGPSFGNTFPFSKSAVVTGGSVVNDWASSGYMIAGDTAHMYAPPTSYEMHTAFPNPFNPTTTIRVSLSQSSELNVAVFNIAGQQVVELASSTYSAGSHTLTFDASNLGSGLYFVRATVHGQMDQTQKLMLVR